MEAEVTKTRTFQRLFYIKHLGLAYLVYPYGTHTRAAHSIECLDEAAKILDSIEINQEKDEMDWQEVRMAALLHDIGHIPFSHTLEDEHLVLPKHDKGERIQDALDMLKGEVGTKAWEIIDRAAPILSAISDKSEWTRDWKSDLVGNTVCADLLAYIKTDAAWTGIEKRPGYYRIYDYFNRAEKTVKNNKDEEKKEIRLCIQLTKGGLRTDIVSAILDLLDMRYALTERVLFHHAKAMASSMLARAARLVELEYDKSLLIMGDEVFLNHIYALADKTSNTKAGSGAKMLVEDLSRRNLYKRIFKIQRDAMDHWNRSRSHSDAFCLKWRDYSEVERLLCKIEDRFKLNRGSLVLWCPEGQAGMKLVKANVIWEPEGSHEPVELRSREIETRFPGVYKRVSTIENQYLDLWTLWIGIHPKHIDKAPAIIDALSREFGIGCDPIFLETYAKQRIPGFEKAASLYEAVDGTWKNDFVPDVSQQVADMAALDDTPVDQSVVTEAIFKTSEKKRKPAKKKTANKTNQPKLTDEEEPDESAN